MPHTYLCATNGIETPDIVAGPFDGNTHDCAGDIERAVHTVVPDMDDDVLLFTLTIRPDAPPEFDWVGHADMFVEGES